MEWVDRIPWQLVALSGLVGLAVLLRYVELRSGGDL